jgi:hypothetical protein
MSGCKRPHQGKDANNFNPKDNTTRVEIAVILIRFEESFGEK